MILVILLVVSTTGMTIDLHYCYHELYDFGVFSQAENCCMPDEHEHNSTTVTHCNMDQHQQSDCEDETVTLGHVDDFLASVFSFNFNNNPVLINSFLSVQSFEGIFNSFALIRKEIPKRDNAPPPLQLYLSLIQTYLL